MAEVDSDHTYRCNVCGYNHDVPAFCSHCGTPECPRCKHAGSITNLVNMRRIVSHNMPEKASELKYHRSKPNGKVKKKTSKKKKSLAELSEKLGIKLDL